jgi:hypothetical protein
MLLWSFTVRSHIGPRYKSNDRLTDHVNGADNKENVNGIAAVDDETAVDSKFVKEIEELAKMKNSGAAKVFMEDLKKKQQEKHTLDPRSASRTPSAAAEPSYKPRYDSPLFACKLHFHQDVQPCKVVAFFPEVISVINFNATWCSISVLLTARLNLSQDQLNLYAFHSVCDFFLI